MPGDQPDDFEGDEEASDVEICPPDETAELETEPRLRPKKDSPRKRGAPRKRTISVKAIRKTLDEGWIGLGRKRKPVRPRVRGDCQGDANNVARRPCPFVGCRHHTYLDIDPTTGSITFNHPDLEPYEITHSCSLDVADVGGLTLDVVGDIMNLTRERIRQIEIIGLIRLRRKTRAFGIESPLG